MEGEESKHVCENGTSSPALQMPRFFSRLVELPVVKSACGRVSGMYEQAKEKSSVAMVGLRATEVSLKAVTVVAKVTYTALPSSGLVGGLKGSFEEKGKPFQNPGCTDVGNL